MPTKSIATKKNPSAAVNPWDICAKQNLTRTNGAFGQDEPLDTGVNFFVLALEALGATTKFSCEGHPAGFYVAFEANYELALEISTAGFFSVEIEGKNYWSIRKTKTETGVKKGDYTENDKVRSLRWAAEAWVKTFGERLGDLAKLSSFGAP